IYGEDALKLRQCQNWVTKFQSGDFNVKDAPRSGRPIEIDDDKIKALIDSNRRLTTREIAENLNISKSSVENHSKRLGYISKLDISVPHELKEIHLTKRIDICDSLLKPEENDPFLKRVCVRLLCASYVHNVFPDILLYIVSSRQREENRN
ncbi:Histone-lysine N-methyltransferase SETMAR, partial [Ooceraea biroi]